MKTVRILLLIAFVAAAVPLHRASRLLAQESPTASAGCSLVQQALADYQRIKPGLKRREVERYFKLDGGLQFSDSGRYVFRNCDYIKLEVEFDPAPSGAGALSSPDDTVRRVSKLFIDYPTRD